MAAYYDFIPTSHQARKVFWIQLRNPPPHSLKFGTLVNLESLDKNLGLPSQSLQVVDIIGTRVVLEPMIVDGQQNEGPTYNTVKAFIPGNQKLKIGGSLNNKWHPLKHGEHWAYTLKDWTDTLHTARNWTFGSGEAVACITW